VAQCFPPKQKKMLNLMGCCWVLQDMGWIQRVSRGEREKRFWSECVDTSSGAGFLLGRMGGGVGFHDLLEPGLSSSSGLICLPVP